MDEGPVAAPEAGPPVLSVQDAQVPLRLVLPRYPDPELRISKDLLLALVPAVLFDPSEREALCVAQLRPVDVVPVPPRSIHPMTVQTVHPYPIREVGIDVREMAGQAMIHRPGVRRSRDLQEAEAVLEVDGHVVHRDARSHQRSAKSRLHHPVSIRTPKRDVHIAILNTAFQARLHEAHRLCNMANRESCKIAESCGSIPAFLIVPRSPLAA